MHISVIDIVTSSRCSARDESLLNHVGSCPEPCSSAGLRVRVGSEEQKGTDLACDATESPGMWMPRTVNYIPPTNFAGTSRSYSHFVSY